MTRSGFITRGRLGSRDPLKHAAYRLVRDLSLVKYCIVGIFVTAVDFLVFSIAFYHLPSSLSKFLAFCTAAAVSFILNRMWTFRSKDYRFFRLMVRFGAVASVGVLLSLGLIVLLVDRFSIHPLVANAATSCAVVTWNFLRKQVLDVSSVGRAARDGEA